MTNITNLLTQALDKNKLSISAAAAQQLSQFIELLQTWNRVFNLTTITEPHEIVYLHIIDSLLVQPFLHGQRLLDVGSGGGLPGIPLAITNPNLHWVLLDKNSKKTRFLTQVIAELALPNVEVVHSRVEDFHPPIGFDSILSRAFSSLSNFMEATESLLAVNGVFIAMKGRLPEEEIAEIPSRFKMQNVTRLEMQGIAVERHVVIATRT